MHLNISSIYFENQQKTYISELSILQLGLWGTCIKSKAFEATHIPPLLQRNIVSLSNGQFMAACSSSSVFKAHTNKSSHNVIRFRVRFQ